MFEAFTAARRPGTSRPRTTTPDHINVTDIATDQRIPCPVYITRQAHAHFVDWTDADTGLTGIVQDDLTRLWDVLSAMRDAIRRKPNDPSLRFSFYSVPRDRISTMPDLCELRAIRRSKSHMDGYLIAMVNEAV